MAAEGSSICIDPSRLDDCGVELGAYSARDEGDAGFVHDVDWVDRVCTQIRTKRYARICMPRAYQRIYQRLLTPQTYPPSVNDRQIVLDSPKLAIASHEELPADLVTLSKDWAGICEHLSKHVTQRLLRLTTTMEIPADCDRHQTHGMLRISYNSSAGPHFDNSFVSIMGPGTVRGALQFGFLDNSAEGDADYQYFPCEHFRAGGGGDENIQFFMFAGVRLASPLSKDFQPLFHKVIYEKGPEDVDRINTIYFLRRYEMGEYDLEQTELEIHAWNRTVLVDRSFVQHIPEAHLQWQAEQKAAVTPPTACASDEEDVPLNLFDWSSDGQPGAL